MIMKLLRGLPLFGRPILDRLTPEVKAIAKLEPEFLRMDDESLKRFAHALKARAQAGEELKGKLRQEAFALVREAARRVLGQRPYDVQIYGGLVLSEGMIAEMRTGEGKTLVAALPTFLFALAGKGVHVVTVNDYLARRDAGIIGRVHEFLGLTVGVVWSGMDDDSRRRAYACDVTYGTNSEFGFDFLRDNLRLESSQTVQRGHHFTIVDEVDSVLIDEARTPLIISGPTGSKAASYIAADEIVSRLVKDQDFKVDEKDNSVLLTEEGTVKVEEALVAAGLIPEGMSLYSGAEFEIGKHVDNALKARHLFKAERDYIVKDGKVVIVDAFTGRMMPGRRFNDGLHQAIEAKEKVEVQPESQTLSSITYQNLFRMYGKLCGMTGTADTEAEEFAQIYGLQVVPIPTHRPVQRIDDEDEVYLNEEAKHKAIVEAVIEAHGRGQPVLIGTASIEKSAAVARSLMRAGFTFAGDGLEPAGPKTFRVLNARNHANEAYIVAQAGLPGAITIATNMAGRGTDIQLGGNLEMRLETARGSFSGTPEEWEVLEAQIRDEVAKAAEVARNAGGLFVIGTERHESRRIDNQLRGRSGRQGDPGRSRFYVSLEDDVTRVFATDKFRKLLAGLGLEDGGAIRHPLVSKGLEKAQRGIEARNYEIRKNVVKYDDIANEQRKAIHAFRQELMSKDDVSEHLEAMREEAVSLIVSRRIPENSFPDMWDVRGLEDDLKSILRLDVPAAAWCMEEGVTEEELIERIEDSIEARLDDVRAKLPPEIMKIAEKTALMQSLDKVWREHVTALEDLKSNVGFRSVAQRDPLVEFRTDAFEMFQSTMRQLSLDAISMLMRIQVNEEAVASAELKAG